jgi:glutamyl-tRNA synthetase
MQGKKLSKRDNITNVKDYIKQGYLTKSIFNFIIKLGNNFNDQEYLDFNLAINNFELNKTVLSPAKFDLDKLNHINQNYLNQLSYLDFKKQINAKNILLVENLDIKKIYESILERCIKLTDINIELDKLLTFYHSHKQLLLDEKEKNLINKIYRAIQKLHNTSDLIHVLNENDLSLKKIGKIIRKIFVNFESKLPIEKIILFYGIGNLKERLLLYIDD